MTCKKIRNLCTCPGCACSFDGSGHSVCRGTLPGIDPGGSDRNREPDSSGSAIQAGVKGRDAPDPDAGVIRADYDRRGKGSLWGNRISCAW